MSRSLIPYVRDRQNGALTPATTVWNWWTSKDSPLPAWLSNSRARSRGFETTMRDTVTPNFRVLQAEGRIINSSMSKKSTTITGSDAGWKFQCPVASTPPHVAYGECQSDWCLNAYGPPGYIQDSALLSQLKAQSATSAWADVDPTAVDIAAALGEFHSTLNMLGDPVREFSDFLWKRAWADADWKKARGALAKNKALAKLLSFLWLYERFAIRPFLMDIEDVMQELQNQTFCARRTARATARRQVQTNKSWTGTQGGISVDFSQSTIIDYEVRASILYEARVSPMTRFGLSWQNMPSAVWELTPWSFVLDWFLNVGDYIRAITPKLDAQVLCSTTKTTVKAIVKRESGAARLPVQGWSTVRSPRGVDTLSEIITDRVPWVDAPSLVLESSILEALRNNRGVDAYMLFLQTFIGSRRKLFKDIP